MVESRESLFYFTYALTYLVKKFWMTSVLFVGPLIPLFWTSGDICPRFQNRSGSSPVCNVFLRFRSGARPADPLMASMAAESVLLIHLLVHIYKHLWDSKPRSSVQISFKSIIGHQFAKCNQHFINQSNISKAFSNLSQILWRLFIL